MNDESELYATRDKSKSNLNDSVNFVRLWICQKLWIPTTFEFGFKLCTFQWW